MDNIMFLLLRAVFITMMTVGMMASMTDFRFGRRKLLIILAIYCLWVTCSSFILLWLGGELLLLRLFYLIISVPAICLTYWAANDTPAQAVFNYTTQIMVSALSASMIRWFTDSLGLCGWVNLLLMCVFYFAMIYLEWRFLRRPFRMLIQVIPERWGILTIIPCVFCGYLILLSTWPVSYLENTAQRIYIYAAVIPLIFVYIAVFRILLIQYRIQTERQNAALLTVQISALKERLKQIKEVEDGIRIQRHDLRHQLQAATELVSRGDRDTALKFLDDAQKRLNEQKTTRWCRPPVLDAVFSYYFDQARREKIQVDASISLADELPVDEGELAVVLANALENAIHANLPLPPEQRQVRCKIVGSPSIMVEISNPCTDSIPFDTNGLPMSRRDGHGLGVLSIAAFCEKYGAVRQFDLTDGVFKLQIIL